MAYRPIQPTSSRSAPSDDDGRSRHDGAATGSPDTQTEARPQGKRGRGSHQVIQACPHCRQSKAKCDGARPRCGNCVAKNKPCGYIGEAGQSRQAAMMARLRSLENLIKSIRTQPQDEAEKIFHRIRGTDGFRLTTKSAIDGTDNDEADAELSGVSFSSLAAGTYPQIDLDYDPVYISQSPVFSGKMSVNDGVSPSEAVDRKESMMAEISLPDQQVFAKATDAFFSFSLQPFHVFSREEVEYFLRVVFPDPKFPQLHERVAIACLAAVAAVGARYHRANLDEGTSLGLYDLARYCFEKVIDSQPLDAVKCCVLLSMHNFMTSSTVALAYVETGLSMAKRQGLSARDPRDTTLSVQRWTEYRKAWRTLLCLSSWIPFTAGFNEEHDDPVPRIPLVATDIGPQLDGADVLQSEMTKVSLLKADLLRARLALPLIDAAIIQSANQDLQSWYSQIPEIMYLHRMAQPNYGEGVQACICYIHLLHLDAIILLSRRAASQFVRTHGFRKLNGMPFTDLDQVLVNQAAQGVLAASHASRILALLQKAGQVRDNAWLLMNQLYAACIILLHSTVQKKVFDLSESKWAEDLDQAATCLAMLETCGLADPLAAQLHKQLDAIYLQLLELTDTKQPLSTLPSSSVTWNENSYLVTCPDGADHRLVELSGLLLNLVCRPFDKFSERQQNRTEKRPGSREVREMDIVERARSVPSMEPPVASSSSHQVHAGFVRKLDSWNFESTLPFRADLQRSAKLPGREAVPEMGGDIATSPGSPDHARTSKAAKKLKSGQK